MVVPLVFSCSGNKRFRINGTIDKDSRPVVYFDEQEVSQIVSIDSVRADRHGRFSIHGRIDYPRFFHIHLGDNNLIPLLIAPGEKVILTCHSDKFSSDYTVDGSEGSEQIFQLNERVFETNRRLDSIENILNNPRTE